MMVGFVVFFSLKSARIYAVSSELKLMIVLPLVFHSFSWPRLDLKQASMWSRGSRDVTRRSCSKAMYAIARRNVSIFDSRFS